MSRPQPQAPSDEASPPQRRVWFVVPPLTGHVLPTLSVAHALQARGHEVAWVGHASGVAGLLPEGATLHALGEAAGDDHRALLEAAGAKAHATRGLASLKVLWEELLVPLARATAPELEALVREGRPDVLVVDQQLLSGVAVAHRVGVPWVTSQTTSADLIAHLDQLPAVRDWLLETLRAVIAELGGPALARPDRSPHGTLVYATAGLAPDLAAPDPHGPRWLVGPMVGRTEPEDWIAAFPWARWRAMADVATHRLLITLGTLNADSAKGHRFLRTCVAALRELAARVDRPVAAVVVAPAHLTGELEAAGEAPDGPGRPVATLSLPFVPQLALLDRGGIDAVVGHGGYNTAAESLSRGLPLVLAPIKDDQPAVTAQVVKAGAGRRVRFGRVSVPPLVEALRAVLETPEPRDAAARLAASFAAAGGADSAAARIVEVAAAPGTAP